MTCTVPFLQENQKVKKDLLEAQTNIAFLQSELNSLKSGYTDQSLNSERYETSHFTLYFEWNVYSGNIHVNEAQLRSNKGLFINFANIFFAF